ncbi:MAG: TM0106 family RecB-like putative nuclease [Candidatus Thiodiazotropha sp. (ex. Lucinisca nassula)]|nr:TM0106 family RecB-like putative nuclease [Candidatus Thiodiazotropha sp. (ex. Lucinisca nassula)]MBW9275498.1 TM0106 family RecB-like putative nuclease [Candidatus Thiodiazotropha sp. (ex. Lucinisca nassula)]
MKSQQDAIHLSASDLVGHLNCRHLTALDMEVAQGTLAKPQHWDPLLDILRERGRRHEAAFIDHLREQGFHAVEIPGIDITPEAVASTQKAMEEGEQIIIQAALQHGRWSGRADILRRIETPSALGAWSYEIIDTKLARETKGGTVLQLCLYADLLEQAQGIPPEYVYVVAPWSDFESQQFRYAAYAAYFRRAKATIQSVIDKQDRQDEYPDPKEHCDVCRWQERCDHQRRDDDHLCLVAGVTKNQITELRTNGITTAAALAAMPTPMPWKPQRGSPLSYEKAHEQARIQIETRQAGELRYELLPIVPQAGLALLPPPSDGDIFFDIEGDPFVGEHGLEYLFGYRYHGADGEPVYIGDWALDRAGEKAIFERFVDFVAARRNEYPDLHIYHYAPYEPGALKRLMGRYATREDEIDIMLYGKVFVDLYSVVRNALRAGVESYSIKKLEPLYGFTRTTELRQANIALASVQAGFELADTASITEEDRAVVQSYNADDCVSAHALRDWLEERRAELIASGTDVQRPAPGLEGPSEELTARQEQINQLIERLTYDVPVDPGQRTPEQQACWILAHLLGWHRRENKAVWWEHFRLAELTADELIDERAALSRLTLIGTVDHTKTGIPTHRYSFEQQDTDLRGDEELRAVGGEKLGTAVAVSTDERAIDIKKTKATADIHPKAVYAHTVFRTNEQADALFRLGQYVADHGIEGDGPYRAGRALLLNEPPPLSGQPIRVPEESSLQAAMRLAGVLEGGVFPIQGPPGTGKSYTGARMICQLISQGRKVGITANSHKVIRNLLDKVIEASEEMGVELCCIQKPKEMEPNQDQLIFAKKNDDVYAALENGHCQVAGATHFLWSRADAYEALDVLVVDEAAQMSLANVVAVAQSTMTLILLGDPQQLDQPTQGTHPDGVGVSSLEHVLQGHHTITADRGLFLEQTWRLHPEICAFNSELFYDSKLNAREGCEIQKIMSTGPHSGSGLRYLPVPHTGNQSSSIEEADAVAGLVNDIMTSSPRWTDREGNEKPLTLDDIVIITPYNAQVFEIQQRLHGARVGTVDKFQGQEAPIAIYSMATSSYVDAPRGMEFLYSANRFNVAISRAKCLAVLVASPDVFKADCKTPRQIQLANAFCRYMEFAGPVVAA